MIVFGAKKRASWTARWPMVPAADWIRTVPPAGTRPASRRRRASGAVIDIIVASPASAPSGIGARNAASATAKSAKASSVSTATR